MRLAIYVLTPQGLHLAKRIAAVMPVDVYAIRSLASQQESLLGGNEFTQGEKSPFFYQGSVLSFFDQLRTSVAETFVQYEGVIFIAATGIVARVLSPLLQDKQTDPAVLVVDQQGKFVISFLSGHLGGANALAKQVAAILESVPVITTATDSVGLPSLDMLAQAKNLFIGNIDAVKKCNAALLRGEALPVADPAEYLGMETKFFVQTTVDQLAQSNSVGVCIDYYEHVLCDDVLRLYPQVLSVGVGCRRGVALSAIQSAVKEVFIQWNLSWHSVAKICSFSAKQDEAGLQKFAAQLGVPFVCYSAEELALFPPQALSRKAWDTFGIPGVCEPAALAGAYSDINGKVQLHKIQEKELQQSLIVTKQKYNEVTVAVALDAYYLQRVLEQ